MTGGHLGDDAESYALGLLGEHEATAVEEHAASCVACAGDLAAAERTVAALAAGLPAVAPPARLERRMRIAVRARSRPVARYVAAAVAALAILALGANDLQLRERGSAADLAFAAIARSHFNHVTATDRPGAAVTVKILYARDGTWLFAVATGADRDRLHLVARRAGGDVDLGQLVGNGASASLFVRPASAVPAVTVIEDGREVARAVLP